MLLSWGKGFHSIGPGFTTTPEGAAMQKHFREQGDQATAKLFRDSSMEFVRRGGKAPLCLVTELPLFTVKNKNIPSQKDVPGSYLAFRNSKPGLVSQLLRGESIGRAKKAFQIKPLALEIAIRFHLYVIELGLETIEKK